MNSKFCKFYICIILLLLFSAKEIRSQESSYKFNKLVWSDEFDGSGAIDTSKWFHQTRLPNGTSWYNNEIQHYTNRVENSFLEDGYLHIMAKKEKYTDQGVTKQYTSARLNSKFAFMNGKVVIRAKLPFGPGTWPALWMMGKDVREKGGYWYTQGFGTTGWPACGEIDIMEHWGTEQNYVSSAMHTPSSSGATVNKGGRAIPGVSDDFHVYAMEWSPEKMVFSVDDIVHYTYNPAVKNNDTWPFNKELYLLFNVAILPSISTDFTESSMVIDYVRVYQDSTVTSSRPVNSGKIGYYPNPFESELSIQFGEIPRNDVNIKIYDINCIPVKSYIINKNKELITLNNLHDLPGGIYLIYYELNDKPYSFRALKI